ncbi:MAG TPA: hypothetical protein DDW30_08350 [Clostridiales bacterium]|nr:hypothetical protein [Clostridiales bacterium]
MNWKKGIASALAAVFLLGALSGCGKKPTESSGSGTPSGSEATEPVTEDTWVDQWYTDAPFEALVNDRSLDTGGTREDGTWFESFSSARNVFWSANETALTETRDGKLRLECKTFGNEAYFRRSTNGASDFTLEVRLRVEHFGCDNGFSLTFGGKRVVIYLFETKLRTGMERVLEGYPRPETVYADIGDSWHTYRITVRDAVAMLWLDGTYVTSFECEPTTGENGFTVFACPNYYATISTIMELEYVSYQTLTDRELTILSPARGETVGYGKTDVTVQAGVGSALTGDIRWRLNGADAGSSPVSAPTVTFRDLKSGVYRVEASCGDAAVTERVFVVGTDSEAERANRIYSTADDLQSSYILNFEANGNGTLTAGDGIHALKLTLGASLLRYATASGEQTVSAGTGSYTAVADGGVAWVYRNGKLLASFRMPYESCGTTVQTTGSISNVTVSAHNATLWREDFNGAASLNRDIGDIGFNYCIELEFTAGHAAELVSSDGAFLLSLQLSEDGTVTAVNALNKNAERATVATLKQGRAVYRVYVSAGIALIYADNEWCGSVRMPETVAPRSLFLSGEGFGRVQVRETNDRFFYSGTPQDADWGLYFSNPFDSYGNCLKCYSRDTELTASLTVPQSGASGAFYLVARYGKEYTNEGIFVGYDFSSGCYRIGGALNRMERVEGTLPTGKVTLRLSVHGQTVELFCNGTRVLTHDTVLRANANLSGSRDINGWGYAGWYHSARASGVTLGSYSYSGDGNPLKDTTTIMIPDKHTVCMFELPDGIYMCAETGTFRSTDGGYTFGEIEDIPKRNINMLVLQSGKVLSILRAGSDSARTFVAYVSSDGCKTFRGPYGINEDTNAYRTAMNGKVMQMSTGRILFVSGETEDENNGELWVYYSDNDGVLWKKSRTKFNYATTGMNIQEGSIVELEDGKLRLYARTDSGFLLYSDSSDQGKTWDTDMKTSGFASVVSAFNVTKDRASGAIYLAWEYNNICDSEAIQYPRTRVGLAVSYDNAASWQYLGDIDELNQVMALEFTHWNIGVWVTEKHVYVTVGKMQPPHSWLLADGKWYNYTVRISKSALQPMARFNALHGPFSDPTEAPLGNALAARGILAISSSGNRVYASGTVYEGDNLGGTRTEVTLEAVASFLGGTLERDGTDAVIRVGNAEYRFRVGSRTATVRGETREMTFAAVERNGSIRLTVADLCELLGLYARKSGSGAIVISTTSDAVVLDNLLAQIGIC